MKKLIFVLLCLWLVNLVQAQETTVSVEILLETDTLVVYVSGNQLASLQGFAFRLEDNRVYLLEEYPAFRNLTFANLSTPTCLVLRNRSATQPLPPRCNDINPNDLHLQILQSADIFWYDSPLFQFNGFDVLNYSNLLESCPAGAPSCSIDYPSLVVEPTPIPELPEPAASVTMDINILLSPDTDGDGLSDFEEIHILNSAPDQFNDDFDGDGVYDLVEDALVTQNPAWANVADALVAGSDRDGDWLFDEIELDLGTDPDNMDTDRDMLSDFLEYYWLGTLMDEPDLDANRNIFPDVIEAWLPQEWRDTPNLGCKYEVVLDVNEIYVVNPEEADTNDIIVGDEVILNYGLEILNDPDNNPYRAVWQGDGVVASDRLNDIGTLERGANCGQVLVVSFRGVETDAPFGGEAVLGDVNIPIPVIFGRVPVAWTSQTQQELAFSGTVEDGAYDYRIFYTLTLTPLVN